MNASAAARIYAHRRIDRLLDAVAESYGISRRRLRANRRYRLDAEARHVAMYLIRRHAPEMSYPDIGRLFGRHHTTAISAERRVREMLERDVPLQAMVLEIEERFLGRDAA